jgi:hypothetical protein
MCCQSCGDWPLKVSFSPHLRLNASALTLTFSNLPSDIPWTTTDTIAPLGQALTLA